MDPRSPLLKVMDRYAADGLAPTVVTELEFYLLAPGEEARPQPLLGRVPGTNLRQQGIQYCMADDLFDCDAFLNDVREACEIQGVPLTAIHSEFSPGQWEINTHHQDDAIRAGDHALLLRRVVKGVARRHGLGATFMAKPFADLAGSGMHIHASVYDAEGQNVFADDAATEPPRLTPRLRHAIAGLGDTIDQGMAIFAPNPNSYRRFKAGAFAP
jgi:glutamine synthetase